MKPLKGRTMMRPLLVWLVVYLLGAHGLAMRRVVYTSSCRHFRLAMALAAEPASPNTAVANDPLLLRAARGEVVERSPVWMMRQAGRHMKVYRDLVGKYPTFRDRSENAEAALEISLQPFRAYAVDGVILFSDILTPLPAMGVDFSISEGGGIALSPIRTREALEGLRRIDVETACPFVGQVLGELRREVGSRATVLGFVGLPFTLATYLVEGKTATSSRFAEVAKLREEDPELLHSILSLLADNIADYACYQIESGAQVMQVFDSWAGHLDDDNYRAFALPYQQAVVSKIKTRHPDTPVIIYMAPDTYSRDGQRLAYLAQTGADIISIDHTIDYAAARAIVPDNIGLQGNLDPHLLRDGPLDTIKQETERILEASGGKYHIMNLGHGIEASTPEPHAAFFVKTVQDYTHVN